MMYVVVSVTSIVLIRVLVLCIRCSGAVVVVSKVSNSTFVDDETSI